MIRARFNQAGGAVGERARFSEMDWADTLASPLCWSVSRISIVMLLRIVLFFLLFRTRDFRREGNANINLDCFNNADKGNNNRKKKNRTFRDAPAWSFEVLEPIKYRRASMYRRPLFGWNRSRCLSKTLDILRLPTNVISRLTELVADWFLLPTEWMSHSWKNRRKRIQSNHIVFNRRVTTNRGMDWLNARIDEATYENEKKIHNRK